MAGHPQNRSFSRAASHYQEAALVQREMAERLAEIFAQTVAEPPGRVLELGCGTGNLSSALLSHPRLDWPESLDYVLTDLSPVMLEEAKRRLRGQFTAFALSVEAACGLEAPGNETDLQLFRDALEKPFGLIAASAVLQWVPGEKLEAVFSGLRQRLGQGGTLLFSTFAPGTLGEIFSLTGRGLVYTPGEKLGDMLRRAGLETLVFEERAVSIRFADPVVVLRHLRATGVNGLPYGGGRPAFRTRSALAAFVSAYRERFGTEDGGVSLTWKPLFFLARKK